MNKILKKYYIAMGIYLIPFITIFVLCGTETNYQAITPAYVTPVEQRFSIDEANDSGDLYSLSVFAPTNINLYQKIVCDLFYIFDSVEISTAQSHMTTAMWYQAGVIQKEQSEEASIINAYTLAMTNDNSINIDYEYTGAIVRYTTASDTFFELGDIVTHVNDIKVTSYKDINNYLSTFTTGTKFTYLRNEEVVNYTTTSSDFVGVRTYDKYNIKSTTPQVTIIPTASTGPSAGFIQTLSIYNMLLEDEITNGKKIVATGTIESDGTIGAIGGMKQKTYSAFNAGAEYLIVPKDNYEEALEIYNTFKNKEKMQLISFDTFQEVISWL